MINGCFGQKNKKHVKFACEVCLGSVHVKFVLAMFALELKMFALWLKLLYLNQISLTCGNPSLEEICDGPMANEVIVSARDGLFDWDELS